MARQTSKPKTPVKKGPMTSKTTASAKMRANEQEQGEMCEYDKIRPESSFSAIERAVQHWHDVLADPDASDTSKMSAANGLARIGINEMERDTGRIHRMSRDDLQAEIARTRAILAGLDE